MYDSLNKPVYERDSWAHGVDELLRRSVHYHVKVCDPSCDPSCDHVILVFGISNVGQC